MHQLSTPNTVKPRDTLSPPLTSQSSSTMRPCVKAGQSRVRVSYSPPSPHTLQPNLSLSLSRWGCSCLMLLPRCLWGSRPRAATCRGGGCMCVGQTAAG